MRERCGGGGGVTDKVDINIIDISSLNVHLLLTPTQIQTLFYTRGWIRLSFQRDIMCSNDCSFDWLSVCAGSIRHNLSLHQMKTADISEREENNINIFQQQSIL
jgi:hypothetical protein